MAKVVSRADLLTAHRAILFSSGLTAGEKAVGSAIVAHYNEDTGQCDPGASRLASLVGVKRDTVFRAIDKLQKLGVLARQTHGGKSHRNSYAIDWQRCVELDRAANRPRMGTVKPKCEPSPDGDVEPSPDGDGNVYIVKRSVDLRQKGLAPRQGRKGLSRQEPPSGRLHLHHALRGGEGAARSNAAEAAEGRRLAVCITQLPKDQQAAAWLAEIERAERKAGR